MLNKYYPPDFDPRAMPKGKSKKNMRCEVRMMLPMTVQCKKCGEYLYRGTKYAARVEYLEENYLGIKKVRFYGKCSVCANPFTMKTDPENEDYEVEEGVTRNFEARKILERERREAAEERERQEMGDAMKALEHRTIESKREMDALDDLDALRAMSRQAEKMDVNALLKNMKREEKQKKETEEQEETRLMEEFRKRRQKIRRLDDEEDDNQDNIKDNSKRKRVEMELKSEAKKKKEEERFGVMPKVKISIRKRRRKDDTRTATSNNTNSKSSAKIDKTPAESSGTSSLGLLGGDYGSSSSSSSDSN